MPPWLASGKMLSFALGRASNSAIEFGVGTMTSASPLAIRTGCRTCFSVSLEFGAWPHFGDCRKLGLDGLIADGRVAIGLTLPETLQERIRRLLALRGRGEEQEMLRMLVFGTGLLEGALQDRADIADAYTPGGSGSGEHDLADEFGAGLRDHLRDEAAQREAEKVDLRGAKGLDERDRVLRYVGDAEQSCTRLECSLSIYSSRAAGWKPRTCSFAINSASP